VCVSREKKEMLEISYLKNIVTDNFKEKEIIN